MKANTKNLIRVIGLSTALSITLGGVSNPAYAGSRPSLLIEAGTSNIFRQAPSPAAMQLEYRSSQTYYQWFQPMAGMWVDSKSAGFAYVGVYHDFSIGSHFIISPSVSAGLYRQGNGRYLGGPFEFQSGINIMYRLPHHDEIGVSLRHISNAHLYSHNPGTETLMGVYSLSF
ncbi:MAG: acyloxyacyl hydrolase [Proteobacteria bacterium]|nr:acyloxyacyl hydrolase [Pseudomonadota bacterium]MDE3207449.1 acyloxyacyl hydrolase [Pseudomonadota bacterium]